MLAPNLLNALYIAAEHPIPEVCLFFDDKLLRGNRATKARADGFDAFESPNIQALAYAGISIRESAVSLYQSPNDSFSLSRISPQPVAVVTLYPGIDHTIIANALQTPVKALILRSFGVGNAPRSESLLTLLHQAFEQEIVVIATSQCFAGSVSMGSYATGNALAQAGVIGGSDMTLEATLAKLHVLLSKNLQFEQVRMLMQKNLRGELSDSL